MGWGQFQERDRCNHAVTMAIPRKERLGGEKKAEGKNNEDFGFCRQNFASSLMQCPAADGLEVDALDFKNYSMQLSSKYSYQANQLLFCFVARIQFRMR